jgi:YD repeat-containing protein
MKIKEILLAFALVLAARAAQAQDRQQTRFYGPDGRSVGTAVPFGDGSVRYYDARGHSLGTSTTTGNTTRFYDASGRPTGSFQFDGRMRRSGTGR